jgi:spermidine synthase
MLILFTVTLFMSSALLFLLQPMFAKIVLPLLGGTPSVWNACVMFFQATLLLGYAYSHLTATRLAVRWQMVVHATLLLLVLLVLPIRLDAGWIPPTNHNPVAWLIKVLVVSVGLPFFVVSTTAPLIQRWFAETRHRSAGDPYFLYAASNAGSIAALLSYPLLIEPAFRLGQQSAGWTIGYGALAVLTLTCAIVSWRASREPTKSHHAPYVPEAVAVPPGTAIVPDAYTAVAVAVPRETAAVTAVPWSRRLKWVVLSAAPSSLMLGVTTFLSTDIAAVPLLWVIPLFLYLATFIAAFSITSSRIIGAAHRALPFVVLPLIMTLVSHTSLPVGFSIPLHLLAFFLTALICHLELAASRPPARELTEFYLWVAVGGLVGGVFNTLLAPMIFTTIAEYPVALLAGVSLTSDPRRLPAARAARFWKGDAVRVAVVGAWTVGIAVVASQVGLSGRITFALLGPAAFLTFSLSRSRKHFGAALAAMSTAGLLYSGASDTVIHRERTFFGVYRVVTEAGGYRALYHGTTLHGRQNLNPSRSMDPLTYYHRAGPIGEFLTAFASERPDGRVGVIGLGTGTLVTYASANQQWTFYEIDPAVVRIASDPHYFTFLTNAAIRPAIVLGDARLSLRNAVPHGYDLLTRDAFSSDAIPVHMMTREALAIYSGALAEHGVVAFHISNRHLDLEPVLGSLAQAERLTAIVRADMVPKERTQTGQDSSIWLMMARSPGDLLTLSADKRWAAARTGSKDSLWTDDFSNIWTALKMR